MRDRWKLERCRTAVAAVLAGALLCITRPAPAETDKPSRTILSGEPWIPAPAPPGPKVIYGADDRIDVYQETDPDRLAWAASTCALVPRGNVQNNGDGTYTLRTSAYNVCPDEPFATQPTAAVCSGFVVGPDLIATAGHCYDQSDLSSMRFVFGFVMTDANTPVLTVGEDQVYHGVELLTSVQSGDFDYAVIRVDRVIEAPGAIPFEIRREGTVPAGEAVGVIGHPAGLPMKIAFGGNTAVRASNNPGYFVANLDTYGGNSGSPVINQTTGIVEGILVRGETDFVSDNGCRRSNVLSDDGGDGEEVSKTTTFADHVPLLVTGDGMVMLNQRKYACESMVGVTLQDSDLAGLDEATVSVELSGGDVETFALPAADAFGGFGGDIMLAGAPVVAGDGVLQGAEGETITVTYLDATHGPGAPDAVVASAFIDCTGPVIESPSLVQLGGRYAVYSFATDEFASGTVYAGRACGDRSISASFTDGLVHTAGLVDLNPDATYAVHIVARDEAGNATLLDNGGACFSLTTPRTSRSYTEIFESGNPLDLSRSSVRFAPDGEQGYRVCSETITALPVAASGIVAVSLSDDDTIAVELENGASFPYLGVSYETIHINSNGNLTLDTGDTDYGQDVAEHLAIPRLSALFADLNPEGGGQIWYRQLGDRIAVTWQGVPRYNASEPNTVQAELFFDGSIRFSYLSLDTGNTFVGLSAGIGLLPDFAPEDLSGASPCEPGSERFHSADSDKDYEIDLQELLRIIQFHNLGGFHCDASGEDGYDAGAVGAQNCTPHDIDFEMRDWQVSISEVLRGVQLFNAIGYAYDPEAGTEDGFVAIQLK